MTLWSALRDTEVRYLLKDTNPAAYNWSNAELLVYANAAIDNLSTFFPYEKTATITAAANTYEYDLPSDFRALDAISWPSDTETGQYVYLPEFKTKDQSWPYFGSTGLTGSTRTYLLGYPDEDHITFTQVPTANLTLYYRAWRPHLSGDSSNLPFGRQWWMAEALTYYVCYQCFLRESGARALLEQWSERPENVVKNPLAAQAEFWHRQYLRVVEENATRGSKRFTEAFKTTGAQR